MKTKLISAIIVLCILFGVCTAPIFTFAQTPASSAALTQAQSQTQNDCTFTPGSGLPGFTGVPCNVALLANYMVALIKFFMRLAIVLAVLMIAIGGFQWLIAIGNASKISNAKETIQQAVLGLLIALTAVLLFNQIDQSFTQFDTSQLVIVDMSKFDKSCFTPKCTMQYYLDQKDANGNDAYTRETAAKEAKDCCEKMGTNKCTWKENPTNVPGAEPGGVCSPVVANSLDPRCAVRTAEEVKKCEDYKPPKFSAEDRNKEPCNIATHPSYCTWDNDGSVCVKKAYIITGGPSR